MEHRCGERLPINLPAIVHKSGGDDVPVTIRNLSHGGAFVAVPVDRAVLRGLVELEFRATGSDTREFLWRAWVIRQQADGAGLMFDDRQLAARLPFLAAQRLLLGMTGKAPARAGNDQ
ncbi:MAG: PilZ domain-containing protein [Chromatiales bacterium]|nr:PilZ domain-containing protein [Chromatiales bacterium]